MTDQRGNILRVNSAFEKISGYSADELVGKNTSLFKSPEYHDEAFYRNLWEAVVTEGFLEKVAFGIETRRSEPCQFGFPFQRLKASVALTLTILVFISMLATPESRTQDLRACLL
ncbi:PAS domain S-box protein [Polynucleobacter necessarius]|uniref:PAS domain S-box protein n=1 Tax=Polynucleobacter necessarius TaxID=576610 RepID=UPI001E332988|nr:PAS domain S-box protein [Polynucleobacter necessarius]